MEWQRNGKLAQRVLTVFRPVRYACALFDLGTAPLHPNS